MYGALISFPFISLRIVELSKSVVQLGSTVSRRQHIEVQSIMNQVGRWDQLSHDPFLEFYELILVKNEEEDDDSSD